MWLGEQLVSYGRITSPAETKRRLSEVTPSEVRAVAREMFREDRLNLALVSRDVNGDEQLRNCRNSS